MFNNNNQSAGPGNFLSFVNSLRRVQMSPEKQECLDAFQRFLQTGDSRECEALADRICQQHGVSRDQGVAQAKNFFNVR